MLVIRGTPGRCEARGTMIEIRGGVNFQLHGFCNQRLRKSEQHQAGQMQHWLQQMVQLASVSSVLTLVLGQGVLQLQPLLLGSSSHSGSQYQCTVVEYTPWLIPKMMRTIFPDTLGARCVWVACNVAPPQQWRIQSVSKPHTVEWFWKPENVFVLMMVNDNSRKKRVDHSGLWMSKIETLTTTNNYHSPMLDWFYDCCLNLYSGTELAGR